MTTGAAEGVDVATLVNAHGLTARVAPFGATLVELRVPDRAGRLANVVLGLDDVADYARQSFFLGATCGRVANRIRDARFTLDGETYVLDANDPPHHLHGGARGFYRARWRVEACSAGSIALGLTSPDGDAGYPGTVEARVVYTLSDDDALVVEMSATTDRPTPLNLAHHSYWNLGGGGTVLDHRLKLFAETYTPADPIVPTGAIAPVAGTPLDFRAPRAVAPDLDHNFVVTGASRELRPVARLHDPASGRTLTLEANQPGVQVYAGRFLDGSTRGHGMRHVPHAGLCLETQAFPDAINRPEWRDQVILRPDQSYAHTMVHRFETSAADGRHSVATDRAAKRG